MDMEAMVAADMRPMHCSIVFLFRFSLLLYRYGDLFISPLFYLYITLAFFSGLLELISCVHHMWL